MSTQPPPDGYGYGYGPPPFEQPPRRPKWPWVVGGVIVAALIATVAGLAVVLVRDSNSAGDETVAAASPARTVTVTADSPTASAPPPAATESTTAEPQTLPTDGILKVGVDIAPGEYAVRPTRSYGGYWERLSCLTGDFTCLLANDNVEGDSYVVVLPEDVALRIDGLELVPTGNPAPGTAPPAAGAAPSSPTLDNTDAQGFVGVPQARCNHTNAAVAAGQTTESLVVVCETGVGRLYYKGVRVADGASIEIDDPVASGNGFTATNGAVQYQLSPDALAITEGSTLLGEEPVLQYWIR
ncbi:hypothetical protein [Rhodococcus sp. NPDC058639]|uniref:hypothetical protein n=1 Tax=Rhodococcus sp. NPDC058639 TaxID=3346570 RepID=UPI003650683F